MSLMRLFLDNYIFLMRRLNFARVKYVSCQFVDEVSCPKKEVQQP